MAPSATDASATYVELEPRSALVWGSLLVAALMVWPVLRTWRAWRTSTARRGLALLTAGGCSLLFVGAPLVLAADVATSGVRVSDEGVETTRLGRPRAALDFADLTEVELGDEVSLGPLTPDAWGHYVLLTGRTSSGERVGLRISSARFTSLRPLLVALGPVVRDRPELSTTWDEPD